MATIVLGICGSIAAYKAAGVASALVRQGHEVHCVCTPAALHFITPLTLHTLSRNPVVCRFEEENAAGNWVPVHIDLAQKADLLCILPATANTMACMAHGLTPNTLTSLYLACTAPVLIFPAMNTHMWQHPATQQNAATLAARPGHRIIGPAEEGPLACGVSGKGRLVPEEEILHEISAALATPPQA
ncbi:MAG: phosphopantothenoylcysteine decarboxylase [Akkermansia sp.]|nr:phosphopantothenoylcysteine decarboxylase [Akkermansia sp.]